MISVRVRMEQLWHRKCRSCSSMTLTAAPLTGRSASASTYRLRDRPEHRTRPGIAGRTGALHKCCPPGRRRYPAAGPQRTQGARERGEHDRDPRVGQGARHRGKGPRPGTRRARGEIQSGHCGLACNPSPPEIRLSSSRDFVHVQLVPAGVGEEMQAASAADDLSAWWERFPVGEHDPVFTGRLGTIRIELGEGEPVIIGALAARQRDPGARHRQGSGAPDVVVPAGHDTVADAHDREIGVVAGPGARVIDVKGIAIVDRLPRFGAARGAKRRDLGVRQKR